MEDLEKENDFYSKRGNWDFSKIKYETIYNPENEFDFYTMIKKYSNPNSLCLDLGTGGGENLLKYYPEVGYIIAIDNTKEMIETANNNLKSYKYKNQPLIFNVKSVSSIFSTSKSIGTTPTIICLADDFKILIFHLYSTKFLNSDKQVVPVHTKFGSFLDIIFPFSPEITNRFLLLILVGHCLKINL